MIEGRAVGPPVTQLTGRGGQVLVEVTVHGRVCGGLGLSSSAWRDHDHRLMVDKRDKHVILISKRRKSVSVKDH